jgi:ankyrin repeat protein
VSRPDQARVRPFVLAAHGDAAAVRAMLDEDPTLLNEKLEAFDETALEAAGHVGRRDILEFLLERGAPLTAFAAAALGRLEALRAFLDADPALANARGVHGFPMMYHAALSGDPAVAALLVERGGRVPGLALHAAVARNDAPMLAWLLERAEDLDAADHRGLTPLEAALQAGRPELADAIRAAGGGPGA